MRFQERQKTKNHSDQQGNHLKASVRYLVYSRLSGLKPASLLVKLIKRDFLHNFFKKYMIY